MKSLAPIAISLLIYCRLVDAQFQGTTGTLTLGSPNPTGCPDGFTCTNFTVTCPGISTNGTGVIADQKPNVPITGMVVFFSGGEGNLWWSGTSTLVPAFYQSLLNAGLELVQVEWSTGWPLAPTGVSAGQELLASRPATVIQWIHDNMYLPLGVHPNIGQCGFCITGNSAGSDQVIYPLTSYGIDSIVDASIPTSGPEFALISKGCLKEKGYACLWLWSKPRTVRGRGPIIYSHVDCKQR
jgi:hypothetical protein